jgi:hypothetical protein
MIMLLFYFIFSILHLYTFQVTSTRGAFACSSRTMEKSVLSDGGHTSVIITDDKTSPDGDATDVFVEKPHHDFHYKTLTWPVGDSIQLNGSH